VELHQVFANLLINAAQAVRDHGQIKISTSRQNGTIVIEIADNGCGIEERHLLRIFEPFFTTKPIGTGRGLGLSSAIVEQLNGRIEVASRAGTGTTVRVCLPVQVPLPTTVASGSTLSGVQRSTMNQAGG
jgi:signal transduction histidine kinase